MNNLFLLITDWKIETPKSYGAFHLVALALTIIAAIVLGIYGNRLSKDQEKCDKIAKRVTLIFGLLLLTIEIYKQTLYTLDAGHYQWYAFPYQFCSVPMYACLINAFIKNQKINNAIYYFLSMFGFVSGVAVMLYPGDVFVSTLTICIHTMIWHGSLLALGVFMMTSRRLGRNIIKEVIPGTIVFTCFLVGALILDIVMYHALFKDGAIYAGQTFNMFFISPYFNCTLPILSGIYPKVPYVVFLFCYLLAFTLGVSIVWGVNYLIRFITSKVKKEKVVNE